LEQQQRLTRNQWRIITANLGDILDFFASVGAAFGFPSQRLAVTTAWAIAGAFGFFFDGRL
jgi:hypothetical protein